MGFNECNINSGTQLEPQVHIVEYNLVCLPKHYHEMWSVVTVCLLLPICTVFGRSNVTDLEMDNRTVLADYSRDDITEIPNQMKVRKAGSFWDDIADWASSAIEFFGEKSTMPSFRQSPENGRKLKYRKAELKFMMKTLLIFKVVLGLILPLGVIASKILSWKAVTLSLMAFMLAKILFIKNLLSGKSAFSSTPSNFIPPYFIHGGPNDLFWKRHGEAQNAFTWGQT